MELQVTDRWSHQPGTHPPVTGADGPPVTGSAGLPPSRPVAPSPSGPAGPPSWSPPNPPPPHVPPAPPRPPRTGRFIAGAVVLVLLLAAGFLVGRLTSDDAVDGAGSSSNDPQLTPVVADDPPVEGDVDEPVAAVAEALSPAVVQIETQAGLGSGVVFDEQGHILTNAHVVGSSDEVQVRFADGSSTEGRVLGADTSTDVAVVQVDEDAILGVAQLALDTEVQVGQLAVAIGSPFGLEQTVTSGIISAVDRPVPNSEIVVGMLQTDAPINSGNSGGALANRNGQVIGINTAIFSNTGDNSGIGFAIPIRVAYGKAQKIIQGEPLATGFLGITGEKLPTGEPGVLVVSVEPRSAAADAGIEVGDVITAVNGDEVSDFYDLAATISAHSPGDEIELELTRDGETIEVTAELGSR